MLIKFLEIYACLYIVISTHEAGHYIALRRFKCPVARLTIGYGSIIRIWHRSTFYSIGIIPGGYTEATGVDKLPLVQYIVACMAGAIASAVGMYASAIIFFMQPCFFSLLLLKAFAFYTALCCLPYKGSDMSKVITKLKSKEYGT